MGFTPPERLKTLALIYVSRDLITIIEDHLNLVYRKQYGDIMMQHFGLMIIGGCTAQSV